VAGRRVRRAIAVNVQYTGHLGHRPVHLVIHDHKGCELPAQTHLLGPFGDAPVHLGGVVAPVAQAFALDLGGRRDEQDDQGVGVPLLHLPGSLEVDLEHDVPARWCVGERRAVEVPEELRPLEEPPGVDPVLEAVAIDECVSVGRFTGAPGTSGPRTAEPQPLVALDKPGDDGALPRPTGAGDDEDQDFEVCVSRASR
jgi:hypothetical protein